MKLGAGCGFPAFPPCLSAIPAAEALAGGKGVENSLVLCQGCTVIA